MLPDPMPADRKAAAVSINLDLYERSKARAKALGFTTWSAYVVQLIRSDLQSGGTLSVHEEPAVYAAKKPDRNDALSPPDVPTSARSSSPLIIECEIAPR